jgi:uncharacterized RmlC-like cupin family protein
MTASEAPHCVLLRPESTFEGKQGLSYFTGISAETAGASGICMHKLTLPPGARAKAHKHEQHETAIYMIEGVAEVLYGEGLREHAVMKPGDYFYIPAGVPHLPYNPSPTESCTAILARTDPNEQESVVLLPELDARLA